MLKRLFSLFGASHKIEQTTTNITELIALSSVEEFSFVVINSKKIDFEQETEKDTISAYEEFDEGDYPLQLTERYLSSLKYFTNISETQLSYELFLTLESSLRHKLLFLNTENIQNYFWKKYNICFFFDKNRSAIGDSKLCEFMNFEEFKTEVLPNLTLPLFIKIKRDTPKQLHYNWTFFREVGNYTFKGANLLLLLHQQLPFPNLTKVQDVNKLDWYVISNIIELSCFAADVSLQGLECNISLFDASFENDIFEPIKETVYTTTSIYDKYVLRTKDRNIYQSLKNDAQKVEKNRIILQKWFYKNILPYQIK